MMARWGLEGMQSFQQPAIREKGLDRLDENEVVAQSAPVLTE